MRAATCSVVVLVGLLVFAGPGWADTILFDNGDVVEADLRLRFNDDHTTYDDFVLSADSTITGFAWSQFDEASVAYTNTILSLFNGTPSSSTLVATFTVTATRTSNGLSVNTIHLNDAEVFGYDYSADGLSQSLSAGTYYLGIHNFVSGGHTLMGNSNGSADAILGFYQSNGGDVTVPTGLQYENAYHAFQVIGTPVPEPGTLALLGLGLFGVALHRRRKLNAKAS